MVSRIFGALFGASSVHNLPAELRPSIEDSEEAEQKGVLTSLCALRSELRCSGSQLPTVAYSQFRQIEDLLSSLVAHIQKTGCATEQQVLLDAIVTDYLPTSLRTYLALPPDRRGQDSADSGVLYAQLATLYATTVTLDSQVRSGASTELAVHGRFLQDKFDLGSLRLEDI
jgi:hypothetical protein